MGDGANDVKVTIGLLVVNSIVLGIFALGITNWIRALVGMGRGKPMVPWEPRRPVPWGFFDLLIAMALVIGAAIISAKAFQVIGWLPARFDVAKATPHQTALLLLADGGSRLLVMPLLLWLIAWRTGAKLSDFGIVPGKFWYDVKLGVGAFTMLIPLVFIIQAILTRYQKYEHELLNVLHAMPGWLWVVGMVFVAGISAPIAEEILFRLLLQGWTEKFFGFRGPTHELVLGAMRGKHVALPAEGVVEVADAPEETSLVPTDAEAPFAPAVLAPNELAYDEETVPPELRRGGWIAIGISSVIFALLHWSNGPAWVALTVLAIGMGYLYQRTHRIVPSLVVHAMLNNLTLLTVLLSPPPAR